MRAIWHLFSLNARLTERERSARCVVSLMAGNVPKDSCFFRYFLGSKHRAMTFIIGVSGYLCELQELGNIQVAISKVSTLR